jgi:hypothetical protein
MYKITATREVNYDFEIEADTEDEAIAEIERIERDEDVEIYAIDWYPLEITTIDEEEEE